MLFDAHIHFFPDKLANKVLPKLSKIASAPYYCDETFDSATTLLYSMGATHALALHIATNPRQQTSVNDFAKASQTENILCFGSVHHKSEDPIKELYRIKEMGLKGVKFHPDYQEFMAGSSEYFPIYKTCEELGLIVTFHCGFDPYSPELVHCPPSAIKNIATSFENLTIIAAHLGGMGMVDESIQNLSGLKNVYFDTAMASAFVKEGDFKRIVKALGANKILFGTDQPWSTVEIEKRFIDQSGIAPSELDRIYFENAFELFDL